MNTGRKRERYHSVHCLIMMIIMIIIDDDLVVSPRKEGVSVESFLSFFLSFFLFAEGKGQKRWMKEGAK